MRNKWTAILTAVLFLTSVAFAASTETVLYNFTGGNDGGYPPSGVISDQSGNLYGVAWGGSTDNGVVYELSPGSSGWTENVLYTFTGASDQGLPMCRLAFDKTGNLYGTTTGGTSGLGTVFELSPNSGGWTYNTIYTFQGGNDGSLPDSGVIIDKKGNLYGTTQEGGGTGCSPYPGCGTVYELIPGSGGWTEKVIYSFSGRDGQSPSAALIADKSGNFYGTTYYGGSGYTGGGTGGGTVFKLYSSHSAWKATVLHSFSKANDGANSYTPVVFDKTGNLYGATMNGGSSGNGIVFQLTPNGKTWQETILHTFSDGNDGANPHDDILVLDAKGNIYGTTKKGGTIGWGVVFKLKPVSGKWRLTALYNFTGGSDGLEPVGGVFRDKSGNLYGTTFSGGSDFAGVVFEVTP
jgi:uncharacterized repeat protein (TIGR03803 family)